jgi:hypothetical protein
MTDKLPIELLIEARCRQLGLSRAQLVQRLYHNTGKGQRRLAQLCQGQLEEARGLVARLPKGLEVSEEAIEQAMQETRREIAEAERCAVAEENARWSAAFRPHAIILAKRSVPQPIFIAALIGVERLLLIKLNLSRGEDSFIEQARVGIREKLREWNCTSLPGFGRPVGFIVNYTPDRAVRYDLDGNSLEVMREARRVGSATLSAHGHMLPRNLIGAVRPRSEARLFSGCG